MPRLVALLAVLFCLTTGQAAVASGAYPFTKCWIGDECYVLKKTDLGHEWVPQYLADKVSESKDGASVTGDRSESVPTQGSGGAGRIVGFPAPVLPSVTTKTHLAPEVRDEILTLYGVMGERFDELELQILNLRSEMLEELVRLKLEKD